MCRIRLYLSAKRKIQAEKCKEKLSGKKEEYHR